MKRQSLEIRKLVIPLALGIACLLLYSGTLAPDVVDADGGEFQFAAWNFGFVHPTGYPLYLLLGGLFQHLIPVGNPAFRLNLFTALTAACAVAALCLAANELIRNSRAAIIAAASFALTRAFWYDSSAAEVYALNAFFLALLIFIALSWHCDPTIEKLAAFCFAFGLALTHHRSIILWIPAFFLFFLIVFFQVRSKFQVPSKYRFLLLLSCFCLPLLLYLYIPFRAPASPYFSLPLAPGHDLVLYDNTSAGFINYILGRVFQSELSWDAVSAARLVSFPQLLFDQFGAVGIALGVIGFVAMLRRKREEWARFILLATGFATTILFASFYHIGDILHYYIPAYLAWSTWIGIGVQSLFGWSQNSKFKNQGSTRGPWIPNSEFSAMAIIALLLLPSQIFTNYPFADRSRETQAREQWTRILSAPIPQNAIFISNDRDEMMPFWYIQYVENTRCDLLGLFPQITPTPEFANVGRLTDSVLDTRRPVYFIKAMPGIEIKYRIEQTDVLWHVAEAYQNRAPQYSSDVVFANRVRVLGYDVAREAGALRVAVYWSSLVKLDRNDTTFLHMFDAEGNKVAQGDDHQVGGEFYPTTLWQVGEILRDEFVIALPPNLTLGSYTLVTGMYASPEGEPLGAPVAFGDVEIK